MRVKYNKKIIEKNKIDQIVWNKIFLPNEILIEEEIIEILNKNSVSFKILSSNLLLNPQKTRKKDDTPFQVFTPFWKNEENLYLKEYNYRISILIYQVIKIQKYTKNLKLFFLKIIGIKNLKNIGQLVKMKHAEN